MEVIWKLISSIINRCLADYTDFHDAIHGLCGG